MAVCWMLGTLATTGAAVAQDVTAPVLQSLSFTPTSIDTTTGSATVTVTARITDDLSGVSSASVSFYNPPGTQSRGAGFSRISGDKYDGVYQGTVTFPQYSQGGIWYVDWFYLADAVGNYRQRRESELIAQGFPTKLTITSNPDTTAPVLQSLSFTPTSIDTTTGSATVTVTARFTDDISGLANASVNFYSPSGALSRGAGFSRISGDKNDGVYQATVTFPQYGHAGIWYLDWFYTGDAVGNYRQRRESDLIAQGFPTKLTATSNPDTTVPVLHSLTFTPTSIDTTTGTRTVTLTARITDDLSGVSSASVSFYSPSGTQSRGAGISRISGDKYDGVYQATITFPQYGQGGFWYLDWFYMGDAVGNYRQRRESDLITQGFPTKLNVTGNDPPVLLSPGNQSVDELATLVFTLSSTDPNLSDAPTYSIASGAQPGMSLNPSSGAFSWTPTEAQGPGSYPVTLRVTDLGGMTSSQTITITVNEVNSAPTAVAASVATVEDAAVGITLAATELDFPANPLTFTVLTHPSHGTLSGTAPNLTYTPDANYHGPDSFTFKVTDGTVESAEATVELTVTSVNDVPVAVNDGYPLGEDMTLALGNPALGVLKNDTDADGDTLTAILVSSPAQGTLTLQPDGQVTYTPPANFNGPVSFTYQVSDGQAESGIATVTITVNPANDPPVAVAQSLTTAEDTPVQIVMTGSDVDGDPLILGVFHLPGYGTVKDQISPNLTYTPEANFNGADTITFVAFDGNAYSAPATITITVTPVNDPPVAVNDSFNLGEDMILSPITPSVGALANDSDADGDTLTAILVSGPAHGTLTLQPDGRFTYTPPANFNGPVSFTYKVNDGQAESGVATVAITVNPDNDAPVASAQSVTTAEDTVAAITLAGSDVDGDTLAYTITGNPAHGTLTGTARNLSYRPWPNYHGPDPFSYQVSDGTLTASATVTLTVTPVNDVPVATSTGVTTAEDTFTPVRLSASDVEAGGYAVLQVFGGVTGAGRSASGGLIEGADERLYGTTEFGGAGDNGTVFRVNRDGSGYTVLHSFAANRSQGVWPRARLVAGPGGVLYGTTTIGGNSNSGTVWKLNTDGTGFAVVLHKNGFPGSSTGLLLGSDGALYGTTVFGGAASAGTVYKVGTDGSGYALLHSFSGLANEGGRPYAQLVEDEAGVLYGTTEVGGADAVNGGTVFKIQKNGTGFTVLQAFTGGTGNAGTPRRGLLLASDGALYGVTPSGGQNAKGTVFKVQRDGTGFQLLHQFAADGKQGGSPQAALVEDAAGVLYGGTTSFGALGGGTVFRLNKDGTGFGVVHHFGAGATDGNQMQGELVVAGNDRLYGTTFAGAGPGSGVLFTLARAASGLGYTVATGPAHGTLSGTAPDLIYTPAANYHGADSFTFTVSDGQATSGTATVAITVTPVNDRPYAKPLNLQLAEDGSVAVVLGANDVLGNPLGTTDVDGDPLTFTVLTFPFHGTFSGTPPNLTYTPEPNFHGTEYLSYYVSDGIVTSSPAGLTLVVTPVNDSPVDRDRTLGVLEDNGGGQVQPQVDVDGDAVTYFVVTPPQHGRVELQGGILIYLPDANYNGPDSYTFKATDGTLESPLYTYTLNVISVNDAPTVAVPIADFAIFEDAADTVIALGSVFTDIDTGGADLTYSVQVTDPGLVSTTVDNAADILTLRYGANRFGAATVTVRATDAGGLFAEDTFVVTVQQVSDNDPGDLDLAFDAGANGEIYGLAVQPDARILMAGNFTSVGGTSRSYLACLNPDGTLDPAFSVNPNSQVHGLLVQPDGSVVLRGSFTAVDGFARNGVARVRPNGAVDADFNPTVSGWVQSVALQADGKVLLGGSFTAVGGQARSRIARVNPAGTLDLGFDPGADNEVIGIAVQPDGKILLAGRFTTVGGSSSPYLARLNPDGTRDSSFNPNVNSVVLCVAVQANGKILIGGFFDRVDSVRRYAIARLNDDGSLDPGFSANLTSTPNSIAVLEDGRIMIGGYFTRVNGLVRNGVARLHPDGTLDAGFAGAVDDRGVHGIALQADGKVLLAGQFMTVGGLPRWGVARLLGAPAGEQLSVLGPDRVEWIRDGTPMEVLQAFFDVSTDGGTTWSPLGAGTRITGGWEKSGLGLSGNGLVRARASVASGIYNGSSGLVGAVAAFQFDHPPVAVAGADQQVVAGTDCVATVAVDGSGSTDADGDALSFTWQLFLNGAVIDTVSGQAAVSWSLTHGTYQAVLTVSTDQNGTVISHSDSLVIEVLPSAPALAALSPAAAYAGGPDFTLTVTGGCFLPGAVVHWNGSPRPTTVVSSSELTAAIPAADLQTGVDIAVATIQVVNGDGQVSGALGFSIVAQTVGTADAAVTQPGETSTVSTAPTTGGEPGVSVTVQNNGDQPLTVLAATYDTRPVGDTAFQVDNGSFVDVQVTGADENVAATVFFYYPSTTTGGMENRVKLRYFDGANWIPVLSSGGLPPAKDTTDNLDGTVSGGRFAVVFDATSTPTIMELTGTVFGMIESEPQLGAITGPTGPVALGNAVSVTANFAVVGNPAAATVRFLWDDGTEDIVAPQTAGSATAVHLYAAPGVYAVTVQVADSEGDTRESRFEYVVIFDPNGGFVTGGGWMDSLPGAYLYDPTLTGRATFGFTSRYHKGQSIPTGQTQFQFQAGDFKFRSTAYEWLVVAGAKAQYKGIGQVNGTGDYGFLLTATDGQLNGGGGSDRFRLKIWDRAGGSVVYDNRRGASDDMDSADPQAIGGGSIVIQKAK